MSIIVGSGTRLLVQGITGRMARIVVRDVSAYGTSVVAGVAPGRGGTAVSGVPVFDFVADAVARTGPTAALVFVPPTAATAAINEAIDAAVPLIVYPGDGLPVRDAGRLRRRAAAHGVTLVGPNTPGVISPGRAKVGFMPSDCFRPGRLGVISKSGSLSYEACLRLTEAGIGQSSLVGVGGDPVKGLTIADALDRFDADDETAAMLVLGEIGGLDEYAAAAYARRPDAKPVAAFVAGAAAPAGRKLGHASAIVSGPRESHAHKAAALADAGVRVAGSLRELVPLVAGLHPDLTRTDERATARQEGRTA